MFKQEVRWGIVSVTLPGHPTLEGVLVVEYSDGPFRSYWVEYGNVFSVVVRSNDVRSGYGAKRYHEHVSAAINQMQLNKWSEELLREQSSVTQFRVIDGGRR